MNKDFFYLGRRRYCFFLVWSIVRSILQSFVRLIVRSIAYSGLQATLFFFFFLLLTLLTSKVRTNYRYRFYYRRNQYNTVFFSSLAFCLSCLSCLLYRSRLGLNTKQQQSNKQHTFSFLRIFFLFAFGTLTFKLHFLAVSVSVFRPCLYLRRFYRPPYSRLLTKKSKTNKTTLNRTVELLQG